MQPNQVAPSESPAPSGFSEVANQAYAAQARCSKSRKRVWVNFSNSSEGAVDQWGNQVPQQQPGYAAAPQVDAYGQPVAPAQPQYAPQVDANGNPINAQAPVQQAPAPIIINIQQNWAPAPMGVPSSVPQGLEYLYFVDRLYIKQQVELFEAFTEFETSNQYKVFSLIIIIDNNFSDFERRRKTGLFRGRTERLHRETVLRYESRFRHGDHGQWRQRSGAIHASFQIAE